MFKHILVPLDGTTRAEYALPIAARIARASKGTVVLLTVVAAAVELNPYAHEPFLAQEILNMASARAGDYLAKVARSQPMEGIETKVAVHTGPAAQTILDIAERQHADLIVMATRGDRGLKRWLVGSTAQQIARHSSIPVLVLRDGGTFPASAYPDASRPLHTVTAVVALDGEELAEEAIGPTAQLVAALAFPAPGILHLTRVVQLPETGDMPNEQRHKAREEAIDEAEAYLRGLVDDLREQLEKKFHLAVTWSVVVDSNIPHALIACAEQGKATRGARNFGGDDLLAVTTHGRSGLPRMVLGSVSEMILGTTKLPLLIVRPRRDIRTIPADARGT